MKASKPKARVPTVWTSDAKNPAIKNSFEQILLPTLEGPVIHRLKEILQMELNSLERKEVDLSQYDIPGWDYRQAHHNGRKAALNMVLDLITLETNVKQ